MYIYFIYQGQYLESILFIFMINPLIELISSVSVVASSTPIHLKCRYEFCDIFFDTNLSIMYSCIGIALCYVLLNFCVSCEENDKSLFPNLPIAPVNSQNELCQTESEMFLENLNNLTLWAYKSKFCKFSFFL